MASLFHVNIYTPSKTIFSGNISSLVAPGQLGYLGILANHAPIITGLTEGKLTLRDGSNKVISYHVKGKGFLEFLRNNAVLLLDAAEPDEV